MTERYPAGFTRMPMWTPVWSSESENAYEALDSNDRMWRLWLVDDPAPSDPFPRGWRFAPVDALDEVNFMEKTGGIRDYDTAAHLIDPHQTSSDPAFQHRMAWDQPALPDPTQVERAVSVVLARYGMDPATTGHLVGLLIEGRSEQEVAVIAARHGYHLDGADFCAFARQILDL